MPSASADINQPIPVDQHSKLDGGLASYGHLNKSHGKAVLHQVFVNCLVGKADRKSTQALPLQEIPLMMRLQSRSGGSVEIVPGWLNPKHVPQVRPLTRSQALDLLQRLRGQNDVTKGPTQRAAYIYTKEDGTDQVIFSEVYGGENGTKHTLFDGMKKAHEAWMAKLDECRSEMRQLTADDITECINHLMPPNEVDELDAEDLDQAALAEATGDAGAHGDGQLTDFLINARRINEEVAFAFAAQVANAGPDATKLTDEQWAKVPLGRKDVPEKQAKLMEALAAFRAV